VTPAGELLAVRGLVKAFGGVKAVSELDMSVRPGEIHALIGPNGSGKTTTLNVISGIYRADAGTIRFAGRELRGMAPHAIAAAGVARTFQNIRLFAALSVRENVMIGRHPRTTTSLARALFAPRATAREERATRERADELLALVGLPNAGDAVARSLPYGDQRRVEIARALATEPRLLLLDEPAAGLNPVETDGLIELIERIRTRGITVLLIEHDMNLVMTVSDRITVLNFGTHIAEGAPAEVARDREVIAAYLGGSFDAA
jgi:branched-chain amino acid transport system ATP-binding protein